ncbi:uncharacterized protein LOC127807600 [Diospyros lotus]|uniref:uncharacterized protein LOC127807600 n=1 Tax=Diospyros lotus TaxID=55363 RepID=UPI0022506827|nr:uncharacterized protein LOC127807600 [Diospyros lotus]
MEEGSVQVQNNSEPYSEEERQVMACGQVFMAEEDDLLGDDLLEGAYGQGDAASGKIDLGDPASFPPLMGSRALSPPHTGSAATVITSLEHGKPGGEVLSASLGGGENNEGRASVDNGLRCMNQLDNGRSGPIRNDSPLVDTARTNFQGRKTVALAVGDDSHHRLQHHPAGNATGPHFGNAQASDQAVPRAPTLFQQGSTSQSAAKSHQWQRNSRTIHAVAGRTLEKMTAPKRFKESGPFLQQAPTQAIGPQNRGPRGPRAFNHRQASAHHQASSFSGLDQPPFGPVRDLSQMDAGHSSSRQPSMSNGLPFKGFLSQQVGQQNRGSAGPKSQGFFQRHRAQTQQGFDPVQPNNKPVLHPKKSWAEVADVRTHRSPTRLDFFPPSGTQSEIPLVKLPSDVIDECTEYWMNTLVGYFIEKRLPFPVVQNIAKRLWQNCGLLEVLSNNSGFYFFRFDSQESMLRVFDEGPYHFAGRPFIIKCWEPGMNLAKDSHSSIPLWIKIHNLPLEGWSLKGISIMASQIGRPLYADPMTEDRSRLGFARVCVEVSASSKFPKYIDIDQGYDEATGERRISRLPIEYQWIPSICSHCKVFGHSDSRCPNKPRPDPNNVEVSKKVNEGDGFVRVQYKRGKVQDKGKEAISSSRTNPPDYASMTMAECLEFHTITVPYDPKDIDAQIKNQFCALAEEDTKLSLVALLETRVQERHASDVSHNVMPFWNWEFNYDICDGGRIWIGYDPNTLSVQTLFKSDQVFHVKVTSLEIPTPFIMSCIYARNEEVDQARLWNSLTGIGASSSSDPWLLLGDFNVCRDGSEMKGGNTSFSLGMRRFNDFLSSGSLQDLAYSGPKLTWTNKRFGDECILRKLDRALINDDWLAHFSESKALFFQPGISDHSPVVVALSGDLQHKGSPFRFLNHLVDHPLFLERVEASWNRWIPGVPMFQVVQKLKVVKNAMKTLNRSRGHVSDRVSSLRNHLLRIQQRLQDTPHDPVLHQQELELNRDLLLALAQESDHFRLRARIRWSAEGDRCSRFFFQSMLSRRNNHRIMNLLREDGNLTKSKDEVADVLVSYFQNLYRPSSRNSPLSPTDVAPFIDKRLDHDQWTGLIAEVSAEEVKIALFSMGDDKAPGPDGFTAKFFKKSWEIVGADVVKAVQSFFASGRLLSQVNATIISLIPKVPHPETPSQFRPISCCNVLYKIITKILANRIKPVLSGLVDVSQAAFVPGRSIGDNVLLAQELVFQYHLHQGAPRCAMKVDLAKAYDTVEWDFLLMTLHLMNFPSQFCGWIRECITTPRYSIKINGQLNGFFPGGRGLRQGDPLSPYLFVLVMQVLQGIVKHHSRASDFQYHWKCEQTKTVMLMFADDLLLFSHGNPSSVNILKSCLERFSSLSGLVANPSKSDCFVSCKDPSLREAIYIASGFWRGSLPMRYLGVPLLSSKLSYGDCQPVIARVIKEIEQLTRNFLWSGNEADSHKAKVAWYDICCPKRQGGLGLKPLYVWNQSLVAKLIWRLLGGDRESLWVQWVHTYRVKGTCFWLLKTPYACPWYWRKLLLLRGILKPFFGWRIGDGCSTFFWYDQWHPLGVLIDRFSRQLPRQLGIPILAKVSDFIEAGAWTRMETLSSISPDLCGSHLPSLPYSSCSDEPYWLPAANGLFSVRTAFQAIQAQRSQVPWYRLVWSSGGCRET